MKLKYISNVVSLQFDAGKCVGCGMCVTVCPHRVFQLKDKKAVITDADLCMECGACSKNCPVNAISVNAGVGCATAVINGFFGKTGADCCCCGGDGKKSNCC
jgi:NAD-dependent dihydropyrimidine dehydrogenase PreA subunit